jgi:hypothetical protein
METGMEFAFELTVSDGAEESTDSVTVTIPEPEPQSWGLQVSLGPESPGGQVVGSNARDVQALQLRLDVIGIESVRLSTMRLDLQVTGRAASIPGARLYLDDGDGQPTQDDVLIGSLGGNLESHLVFGALDRILQPGQPAFLLVQLDLPGPVEDHLQAAATGPVAGCLFGAAMVLLALGLAGRRRLVLALVLLAAVMACQRIGFENWTAHVTVGLMDNHGISATSPDGTRSASVSGAPVMGEAILITNRQDGP